MKIGSKNDENIRVGFHEFGSSRRWFLVHEALDLPEHLVDFKAHFLTIVDHVLLSDHDVFNLYVLLNGIL